MIYVLATVFPGTAYHFVLESFGNASIPRLTMRQQSSKKMLGKGYSWVAMLHSGGRWSGDYLVLDMATYAKNPDGDLCHVHRVKDITIPDGKFIFPVKDGTLRHHNPEAHDE
eukprot:2019733-Pyramimonas_sp.AAC.1